MQKGLLIFQFSLSLVIIIFLSAYYQQFTYAETLDPGFTSKNILTIPIAGDDEVFANEVSRVNGVEMISRVSEGFGLRGSGSIQVFKQKPTNEQGILCQYYFTDASTIPMHKLHIVAGSNFPDKEPTQKEQFVVMNEKAANALGFVKPDAAVNKTVWLNDSTQVIVLGVVKNFYDQGALRNVNPLVFRSRAGGFNYLNIFVGAASKEKVIQGISSVWEKINPHTPFEYEWLEKKIADREDQRETYTTLGFLAFISISIASLGLLGLVVYTVETRQKEIGIRKIIGANVKQLLVLLSKGFLKLLLVAGLIAMPVGYIVSFMFLQNFANRVSFGIGSLLFCFMFLLLIGLTTILVNTYRAATANPVKSLRNE